MKTNVLSGTKRSSAMGIRVHLAVVVAALALSGTICAGQSVRAVVARPVVNMYSKPSAEADVTSQSIYATPVDVVDSRLGWSQIRTPDAYTGWVENAALRVLGTGEQYPSTRAMVQIEARTAHVYREADVTKHAPVVTLPFDVRLEVAKDDAKDARWLQVRLVDGTLAWIQRGDVTAQPHVFSIDELVELSQRFLGLPYTWGGASAYGYDCSGFVQMLVRRGGVLLPRDAQPQADWSGSKKVERGELQPGDLVYFGKSDKKITHTGFYIGGGRFIHATTNTHPVIQISRIDEEPWKTILVACRRWKN